jgi:NAD(P)-dependent dehydrogenase (short-subunit alcohol dehydrogenase family)
MTDTEITQENMAMKIEGAAAIVTGGGSGLGRATAEALAAKGARVAVLDLNMAAAEAVAQAIGGIAIAGDVADAASAEAAIAQAEATHGPARILVNCAGIGVAKRVMGKDGPHPLGDFEKVIRVNLVGTFNMIRLVAVSLVKAPAVEGEERGVIISTASVAAYEGQVGQAAYSASKGGVVAMTLPIARDLAQHGIRVNTIAPGIFLTPMLLGLSQEFQDSLGRSVPYPPRLGDPKEYGALAVHIVENEYLNGETIRIDGALRMAPR